MRPLLLPGLLDAAAHNAAHGREHVMLFESARAFRAVGSAGRGSRRLAQGRHAGLRRASPGRPAHGLGAGRLAHAGAPARLPLTRALVDALMVSAGVDWHAEPGERPFLHPGRAARVVAGDGRELGWIGELHPLVARDWELDGPVAGLRARHGPAGRAGGEQSEVYRDVTSFPSVRQDIAVVVPDAVPAAEVERAVRAGAGELLAGLSVFDLYRGEQVGEGRKSLALRLEFRAQDRTLTDEDVAEPRARDRAGAGRSGRGPACLTPVAFPWPCWGPPASVVRLCARLVDRHPSMELTAATARAEAGRRHDEIYPRYGVDRVLEVFDADAVAERAQAALVAYPHKAAAPAVSALRERGLKVVDLSADFRLDQESYERWYQPHEAPELLGEAVYGLPEAHREEIRARLARGRSRLQLHRRAAGHPAAEGADRGRGVRHQGRGIRRGPRGHRGDPLLLRGGERERLQGRGPSPQRGDRAGAGTGALQLRDPPDAARPGHSGQLLPHGARPRAGGGARPVPRRTTPASRSWRWWTRRRTRVTCRTATAVGFR